jgi:hypothetical protein
VKKLFIFFTVFYFLHRFHFFIYFFSLGFSVKKAFQKTKILAHFFPGGGERPCAAILMSEEKGGKECGDAVARDLTLNIG